MTLATKARPTTNFSATKLIRTANSIVRWTGRSARSGSVEETGCRLSTSIWDGGDTGVTRPSSDRSRRVRRFQDFAAILRNKATKVFVFRQLQKWHSWNSDFAVVASVAVTSNSCQLGLCIERPNSISASAGAKQCRLPSTSIWEGRNRRFAKQSQEVLCFQWLRYGSVLRSRLVINARVDDAAIMAALMPAHAIFFLQQQQAKTGGSAL